MFKKLCFFIQFMEKNLFSFARFKQQEYHEILNPIASAPNDIIAIIQDKTCLCLIIIAY